MLKITSYLLGLAKETVTLSYGGLSGVNGLGSAASTLNEVTSVAVIANLLRCVTMAVMFWFAASTVPLILVHCIPFQ